MQVTETLNEGLKREIAVVVPAADMVAKRDEKLVETKNEITLAQAGDIEEGLAR